MKGLKMERINRQSSLTNKLKRYTIYPLLAMGVLWGGLSHQSYADQPDATQIEQMLKLKVTGKLTQSEKVEALEAFKENAKGAKFPKEFVDKVTLDTISDYELIRNRRLMYLKDGIYITLSKGESGKLQSFPVINRYEITSKDIAEPLPPRSNGINTVTKKPYFSLPKGLGSKLSDKEYFKTLLTVMNTNFGNIMQMYNLDPKKLANNKYAGKMADERRLYFGEGYDVLEKGLDDKEVAIRRKLGFVVDGAIEIMKAGGSMHIGVDDCTGYTFHSIDLKDSNDGCAFLVFNGISNRLSIIAYRDELLVHKSYDVKDFQKNFHELMREHGVEPGTDLKDKSLDTPVKQAFAYLGNVTDNYFSILKEKVFFQGSPARKPDVKDLNKYVPKEISTPVKGKPAHVSSTRRTRDTARGREGR